MAEPHTEVEVDHIPPCDFGATHPVAYADANLGGPWANVCKGCFDFYGCRLGLGLGQRYVLRKES